MVIPRKIKLQKKYNNKKGYLVSLEDYELDIEFKRIFWISGLKDVSKNDERGNHGHANADELIIVLRGSCHLYTNGPDDNYEFILNNDEESLYLPKNNILVMKEFSDDALLLVICNVNFRNDEIIY